MTIGRRRWRYRDYVIRSIAQDKSVAQFIREQLQVMSLPMPAPIH